MWSSTKTFPQNNSLIGSCGWNAVVLNLEAKATSKAIPTEGKVMYVAEEEFLDKRENYTNLQPLTGHKQDVL